MNVALSMPRLDVRPVDLNEPALEDFVRSHPDATPFHLPQWSRAISRGTGHQTHFLAAIEKGSIFGILPLTWIRSRLFGSALVSSGFGVGGGILSTCEQAASRLQQEAIRIAGTLDCNSIELRGGWLPPDWRRLEGTYAGFAADLASDDEAIMAAIPRKQRAEVRRALGLGLTCSWGDGRAHYQVYAESVRNLGTPVFPKKLFDAVTAEFGDDADILTVSRDGTALASVLSLYFRGTVYPYWGGGTRGARKERANDLLYFELMRHASRRGCTRFDFGRSKVGTGAFAFKKNWGFEPRAIAYAAWGELRQINPLDPRYRARIALWQRLPLWAANRIGPMIARGLG
jgi:FemAB-related protein (PEP-CTERM system-associated)